MTIIKHKRGTGVPAVTELEVGEIAIDTLAAKLYTKIGNAVVELGGGGSSDGGSPVHIGDTAPSDPAEGDLWYDTSSDTLFLFDGTTWFSTESCGSGGIEEAPEDGTQYARKDAAWEPVEAFDDTQISADLAQEVADREAGDLALQAQIDALSSGGGNPPGYDDFKAIASGVMTTGEMVVLNDNGSVSVVEGIAGSSGLGNFAAFSNIRIGVTSSVYDRVNNKVVIAYMEGTSTYIGKVVVGTVSGDSISFGSPEVFSNESTAGISSVYDPVNNKVVIAYEGGDNKYGKVVVGTVSGDSISFGSPNLFYSNTTAHISAVYDPVNNKVVIAYRDVALRVGTAVVGTVSGDSISFRPPVAFNSTDTAYVSTVYDPEYNKVLIFYSDVGDGSRRGKTVVGTVSGNSISFEDPVLFSTDPARDISAVYDPVNNKVVIAYRDYNNDRGNAVVGTVSGNSISFGVPILFNSSQTLSISTIYDSAYDKLFIFYSDAGSSKYGKAVVGTVSGNSISLSTPEVFNSSTTAFISTVYDPVNNKVVTAYKDESKDSYGYAITYSDGGFSTNLTDFNFIGVSKGDYADGALAIVQIAGINADQQGMTIGKQYVQRDGSLDTAEGIPSVLAGTAISSTELNIKDTV